MFLGLREIRHAAGRFSLISAMVALITLLLIMLSGLTAGLAKENTAALENLEADQIIFDTPSNKVGFTDSLVDQADLDYWRQVPGVTEVEALGIAMTRVEGEDTEAQAVALFAEPGIEGAELPASVAEFLNLNTGDEVMIGGKALKVSGTDARNGTYSHLPVIVVDRSVWQQLYFTEALGTVLVAHGDLEEDQWAAAAQRAAEEGIGSSTAVTTRGAFVGLPAYGAQRSSLMTMQGFLYVISALVTISFLTVWTIQRSRELSVLRALGAPKSYLLKDAISQAAIILAVGVAIGAVLALILGSLAQRGAVPFNLNWVTVVGPVIGTWVLGVLGAVIATRSINKLDPLTALGGTA